MVSIDANVKKNFLKVAAEGPNAIILDEVATSVGCLLAKMAEGDRKFYRHCVKQIADDLYEGMQDNMDAIEDPENINLDCKDKKVLKELDKKLKKILNELDEGDFDDDSEED